MNEDKNVVRLNTTSGEKGWIEFSPNCDKDYYSKDKDNLLCLLVKDEEISHPAVALGLSLADVIAMRNIFDNIINRVVDNTILEIAYIEKDIRNTYENKI